MKVLCDLTFGESAYEAGWQTKSLENLASSQNIEQYIVAKFSEKISLICQIPQTLVTPNFHRLWY